MGDFSWNKVNQILIRRSINAEGLLRLKCLFLQRRNVFPTEIIIILQFVKPLLEIQNLSVAFNNKIVVNTLSYALFPGKITAVVGGIRKWKISKRDVVARFTSNKKFNFSFRRDFSFE